MVKVETTKTKKTTFSQNHGVGRRKAAVARVWMKPGKGEFEINGKDYATYFDTIVTRENSVKALAVCEVPKSYTIKAKIHGGGLCAQSDAVKLGIARALVQEEESRRKVLRENGLLTVDARVKERKKPGQPGARKKFQFVKR